MLLLAQALSAAEAQSPTTPPVQAAEEAPLADLRGMRDALIRARDYAAALDPAQRTVAQHTHEDAAWARDLLSLAQVQIGLAETEAAESSLLRAMPVLERDESSETLALLDAYRLLANVHVISDRPLEALVALEQARNISRRNLGLFNLEQMDLLDRMTSVQLSVGDTLAARRLQEQKLETALRHFGRNAPEVIPYRYALADYYDRSRLRQRAREQYQTIVDIQESALGVLDPALLPALCQLLALDILTNETSSARDRIAAILAADPTSLEAREHASALAALGDWEAVNGSGTGSEFYERAYAVLARESPAAADEFFATPRSIDFVPPLGPVDRATRNRSYGWGTIVLRFDVSADGRASSARVLSADPPGIMDAAYLRRVTETRFRPRLLNGAPAVTEDVRLTHSFRFYIETEDDD